MLSHQPLPVAAESQIYYAWKIPAYFTADGKVSSLAENGECVIRVAQRNTGDSLKTSISGKFLIEDTVFIRLASPLGGESFRVGDTLRIAWSTKYDPEFPVDAVDVKMSADSGKTWAYLRPGSILPESRYWGLFPWVVADSISVLGKKAGIVGNPGVCVRVEQYTTTDPKHSFQSGMISILPR
jgi:hypothetical protein